MKFKRMMLAAMLLLAILTIGAASAAEDADALAVNDTGGGDVLEAPADDASLEADENVDELEDSDSVYIYMGMDNITDKEDWVSSVDDWSGNIDDNSNVTVFANSTQVFAKKMSPYGELNIRAKDLIGSFNGLYYIKVVYEKTDGTNISNGKWVNFENIVNRDFSSLDASEFQLTILNTELDMGTDSRVPVFSFYYPENIDGAYIEIRYNDDKEDYIYILLYGVDGGTYMNVTLNDLYTLDDIGDYNITIYYLDDDDNELKLANTTLSITKSYKASDFIELYKEEVTSADDYIFRVHDLSGNRLNGAVTVLYNGSSAYSKTFYLDRTNVYITGKDLIGSFNGTCKFNVSYQRAEDGKTYSMNLTVNFINPVVNKALTAEDFNFTFVNTEVDIKDTNATIIRFYCPEGIDEYNSVVRIRYGSGYMYEEIPLEKNDINKCMEFKFGKLYIWDPGTYNLTVSYLVDDNLISVLGNTTLKVTKTYTADNFIELYTKYISDPTDYVCNVFDSDAGLKGTVTVYAGGSPVYTNQFTGQTTAVRINWQNLTGDLDGSCVVKVVYNRSADGKSYSKQETIQFSDSGSSEPEIYPEDFNVTFVNTEVDVDDENATVIRFYWPSGIYESGSSVRVKYGPGDYDYQSFDAQSGDTNTYREIKFGELYLWSLGTYNLTVFYNDGMGSSLKIANGTLDVVKKTFTADDFIEVTHANVSDSDDFVASVIDTFGGAIEGTVTILANNTPVYTNTFTAADNMVVMKIRGENISGSLNGAYAVKVVYNRAADGVEYYKNATIVFNLGVDPGQGNTTPEGNGTPETNTTPGNTTPEGNATPEGNTTPETNPTPATGGDSQAQSGQTATDSASQTQAPVANTVKLTLKTVTVKKSAKKLVLQATLKINGKVAKSKKVTFKFNGKKYTAKTNAKGVAKVTIKKSVLKKLKVGKKITYQASYGGKTVKKTVKVKK